MAAPRVAMPVAQPVAKSPRPAPVAAAAAGASSAPGGASVASSASSSSAGGDEQVDAKLILDMPATHIYKLTDGSKRLVESGKLEVFQSEINGQEVYILILGGVRLALRHEVPCLEMSPRNFVFPTDGATYGLVVAPGINDDVLDVFRILLVENTSFRSAAAPQDIASLPDQPDKVVSTANSVAAGLGAGSVVVATGVIRGGKMVGGLVVRGGEYLASKLKPNAEATKVSEASKARLQKAKFLSGAACKVSKALVIGAMATTDMLSQQLSGALKDTEVGKKLSSDPEHPNHRLDAAKHVGKATIGAVLTVYQAIETAVFGVAHDVSAATVTVVTHKYGQEAGQHSEEVLGVAGNVAVAAHQVNQLGARAIAKKTLVKTGQEVLTTPAERAAAEAAKQQAAAAAGPGAQARASMGAAMGLPEGIDPLMALEAASAVAQLSAASNSVMADQRHAAAAAPAASSSSGGSLHAHSASRDDVIVSTATATGATPAIAQANAQAAANAGAARVAQAVAEPVKK